MLDGEVEYAYQRREVDRTVRHARGVVGNTNNILVVPRVSADQVEAKIEEAFRRDAEVDARHITIEISDDTAKLYGNVRSLREATDAAAAAAAAAGVSAVESHLVVSP
jgi:osmotically-inducible protein OsmY